jgi:transposase
MCLYVRELRMDEGQKIQRILRHSTNRVKVRRAQVVLASEQGYKAPAIAELVHYSEHHVRAIINQFNQQGLKALEATARSGRQILLKTTELLLQRPPSALRIFWAVRSNAGRWKSCVNIW